ncbi:MAG TPA: ankyrin repeat domain-containing protein [Verrucomicrobiae bacterium]|nr:ankyrin repeat domain-containing protein [Verrucomicrobiae bacterium]
MSKPDPIELCHQALRANDAALLRRVLAENPALKKRVNDPVGPFDSPVIICVRTREMLDVLLEVGADINARSNWWAGSFGLLDTAPPELAPYAIERGAVVTVHAAARLGMMDKLREMITRETALVHARGGDGQTPLHFAKNREVAEYLLEHGANIDARDVDHESTPAQYMIQDRQDLVRYLIQRGCGTDIFMAAALGDLSLARKHLDSDPDCVTWRINEQFFPKSNPKAGGTIYNWTLGWHLSPHEVAKKFGHDEIYQLLIERSPSTVRLINACWLGDQEMVESVLQAAPEIAGGLSKADQQQIAHAARNDNLPAVRLLLKAGFPVEARGQHGATPIYWAAWHGNVEMVQEILRYKPRLETDGLDFPGTVLGWAIHGSENGWHRERGDYPKTVEELIRAGAKLPEKIGGTPEVQKVLNRNPSTT